MSTWDPANYYFSGQGTVLIGERNAAGKATGLVPVGNVSDLKIAIATQVLEHKESYSGARGIDLRLTQETKATLSATLESFNSYNLGVALRGATTMRNAGTSTTEAMNVWFGKVVALAYPNWTAAPSAVRQGTQSLTAYVNDSSAWDYKYNAAAGSIQFNDGQNGNAAAVGLASTANAGATALSTPFASSAVTGGMAQLTLTFATAPGSAADVGKKCMVQVLTGTDAALINGRAWTIVARTATTLVLDISGAKSNQAVTVTGAGTSFAAIEGGAGDITYTYGASNLVQALTAGEVSRWLRFEGLNTADSNASVIVDVFKFSVDPLKELSLISEGIGQITLEGNVLADPLQGTSKYFNVIHTR